MILYTPCKLLPWFRIADLKEAFYYNQCINDLPEIKSINFTVWHLGISGHRYKIKLGYNKLQGPNQMWSLYPGFVVTWKYNKCEIGVL